MTTRPHDDDLCILGQGSSETRIPADLDHVRGALNNCVAVVAVFFILSAVFVACTKIWGWNLTGFLAGIGAVAAMCGLMWIMAGSQRND